MDLESEESKEKIERIFLYINEKCVNSPKIYVFGMISNLKQSTSVFTEAEIKEYLSLIDDFTYLYEVFELASERKMTKVIGNFLKDATETFHFGEKARTHIEESFKDDNSGSCHII